MQCSFRHDPSLTNTEAFAVIAEAWHEMVQENFTPDLQGLPPYSPSSQVVYAISDDGDIVGVVIFAVSGADLVVQTAYVEPSSRKQGVFAGLMDHCRVVAKKQGVTRLRLDVPIASDLPSIMERLGFSPVCMGFGARV